MHPETADRLERLLQGARRVADPRDELGREARERWRRELPLSPEGIDLALERCLELFPSEAQLEALVASVVAAPCAHVLLSSTVFTAAHRAIAVGLAASPRVRVRPSRRDRVLSELLARATPGLFEIVPELSPSRDDHVYAYASASTLDALQGALPKGSILHAHGPGFGVVAAEGEPSRDTARALALDVALFEQRGCLSPRALVVQGEASVAERWAMVLAESLEQLERSVPRGRSFPEEAAESVRYRDTFGYAGALFPAGAGFVGLAPQGAPFRIAPVGRHLHVIATSDAAGLLRDNAAAVTTHAVIGSPALAAALRTALPSSREAAPGCMQTPPLDGPVDRRLGPEGQRLG